MSGLDIGFGLQLHPEAWASFDDSGFTIDLTAELREGKYVCALLQVASVGNHAGGVTGEALREITVARMLEDTVRGANGACEAELASQGREIVDAASGPTPEAMEVVAAAYRYGHAIGDTPTREVMNLLGLSRSRAGRWVSLARDQGLLAGTREREPGGVLLDHERLAAHAQSVERQIERLRTRLADLEKRRDEMREIVEKSPEGTLASFAAQQEQQLDDAIDRELELLSELQHALHDAHQASAPGGST